MVAPGQGVVTSDGAYPTFNYHVAGFGGVLHKVPYLDDAEDPSALTRAARETGARLVYLANPDNPMGSWHSAAVVQDLLDALPDGLESEPNNTPKHAQRLTLPIIVNGTIGMPGDRVKCCTADRRLLVNVVPITEPYVYPGDDPSDLAFDITVPADKVWVMGDHRSDSKD